MIALENVSKIYHTRQGGHLVLDRVNLQISQREKVGIIGRNGAGKSTLIRLIGGAEYPTSGKVSRRMSVSWPLAFGGTFHNNLTGFDNLRFVCRIYGVNFNSVIPFVEDFTELGRYLREPVEIYSDGMRARLAFALSLAIEFDCFLIDEVLAVGDSRFHEKCRVELFEKRKDRALVIVTHDLSAISAHCDRAAVLSGGQLHVFEDVPKAISYYQTASA